MWCEISWDLVSFEYYNPVHYNDVTMSAMAFRITCTLIVCSIVYSGAHQRNTKAPCHWLYDGNPPVTAIHNCLRFRPLEFRELSHWRQQYVVIWMDDVCPLQWRHNGREGVSNHHSHGCLLNRISRSRSKKKSKLRVTGLCEGNSPVSGEFPAQMANYTEDVAILMTSRLQWGGTRCTS